MSLDYLDCRSAESELRKAVAISPDDPVLLTSLGGILGIEGDLQHVLGTIGVRLGLDVRLDWGCAYRGSR